MRIRAISDFRQAVRSGPYAWPGGYPLYWIMADGEACSFNVAKTNRRLMLAALRDRDNNDWLPVAVAINWEDPALFCAHTGGRIESAYGEDATP